MEDKEELKYRLALQLVPRIGSSNFRELLALCGSAKAVFEETPQMLSRVQGVGKQTIQEIKAFQDWHLVDKELKFIEKHKIQVLVFHDEKYPKRLRELKDAPAILYYRGTADLNKPRFIGIVGTRRATNYGKEMVSELIKGLASYNIVTVSGLAYGIDIAAHKQSMSENVPSIGVLAHGLDVIYPNLHRNTAVQMSNNGGLISEYPSETVVKKEFFPRRNRIIAGMVDALVVVETAEKGGSLITAEIAFSYNREVFAYPGRVGDSYSKGCNFLLKSQKATLIESAEDLIFQLGWPSAARETAQAIKAAQLNGLEKRIYELIQNNPEQKQSLDTLSMEMNINQSELSLLLLNMEFDGYIKSLPAKMYQLC